MKERERAPTETRHPSTLQGEPHDLDARESRQLSVRPLGARGGRSRRGSSIRSGAMSWRRCRRRASISRARSTYARKHGQGGLRNLSYAERGKLIGAVADVLAANRARYEEIADRQFRKHQDRRGDRHRRRHRHAEILCAARRRARRRPHAARREAGAARQGGELSGHSPDGAAPRRRHPHQRLQFPELGAVGEGRGVAARGRAGAGQARVRDRAACACHGAGT